MNRWSISNLITPISYNEFTTLSERFKRAAEASFGTPCKMEISALKAPKVYTTFLDDDIQDGLDHINAANAVPLNDNSTISRAEWDRANYVELTIRPVDEKLAPSYAFAHAEFKGGKPRQATFYIQPDGEDARKTMLDQARRLQTVGDGFDGNGTRSGAIPAGLGFLRRFL